MNRRPISARRRQMLEMAGGKALLTTGEAAEIIGCCPRSVAKWFDMGILQGTVLPTSSHRRIYRESVEAMRRRIETVRSRRREG